MKFGKIIRRNKCLDLPTSTRAGDSMTTVGFHWNPRKGLVFVRTDGLWCLNVWGLFLGHYKL